MGIFPFFHKGISLFYSKTMLLIGNNKCKIVKSYIVLYHCMRSN